MHLEIIRGLRGYIYISTHKYIYIYIYIPRNYFRTSIFNIVSSKTWVLVCLGDYDILWIAVLICIGPTYKSYMYRVAQDQWGFSLNVGPYVQGTTIFSSASSNTTVELTFENVTQELFADYEEAKYQVTVIFRCNCRVWEYVYWDMCMVLRGRGRTIIFLVSAGSDPADSARSLLTSVDSAQSLLTFIERERERERDVTVGPNQFFWNEILLIRPPSTFTILNSAKSPIFCRDKSIWACCKGRNQGKRRKRRKFGENTRGKCRDRGWKREACGCFGAEALKQPCAPTDPPVSTKSKCRSVRSEWYKSNKRGA